jgi:cytochrome P450
VIRAQRLAPGPPGRPLVGCLPELHGDTLGFMLRLQRRYGDLVQLQLGRETCFLLSDPDYARQVLMDEERFSKGGRWDTMKPLLGDGLLTASGALWRRHRRLLSAAFRPEALHALVPTMAACAAEMLDRWHTAAPGAAVDVSREMMQVALQIAVRTLFGDDAAPYVGAIDGAFHVANRELARRIWSPFARVSARLPSPRARAFSRAIATLNGITAELIQRRRAAGVQRADLLGLLLEARDPETGAGLSDRELRDEALTMLLAGHETTANAMTWAWHLLGYAPEVAGRLAAEAAAALGGRVDAQAAQGLGYTWQVVQEAMRLYPPIWMLIRRAEAPAEVGGVMLPAGCTVIVSPYVIHHHPAHWDAPARFDPDRFSPERAEGRHRFAFFPFGGGRRSCIGKYMAALEARVVVGMIAREFRLTRLPGQRVDPLPLLSLRPRQRLRMRLERRERAAAAA